MKRVIGDTRNTHTVHSRKHKLHVVRTGERASRGEGCMVKEYWGVRHPGVEEIFIPKDQIQDLIDLLTSALRTL